MKSQSKPTDKNEFTNVHGKRSLMLISVLDTISKPGFFTNLKISQFQWTSKKVVGSFDYKI